MLLQRVMNHPVHIVNNEGEFSPSSFIPFCSFGEEFIGLVLSGFDIPVCNIFKPRIHLDQLCYETNLQNLKDNKVQKIGKQLVIGLTLVLDYNEERQSYNFNPKNESQSLEAAYQNDHDVSIFLDTKSLLKFSKVFFNFTFQILWSFMVKVDTIF